MGKPTIPILKSDSKIFNVNITIREVIIGESAKVKAVDFEIKDINDISISNRYLKRGETYFFKYDYVQTLINQLTFRITYYNGSTKEIEIPHSSYFRVPNNAKTIEFNSDPDNDTWVNIKLFNGVFSMWKLDNVVNRRVLTRNFMYASKLNPHYLSYQDRKKFGYNIRP